MSEKTENPTERKVPRFEELRSEGEDASLDPTEAEETDDADIDSLHFVDALLEELFGKPATLPRFDPTQRPVFPGGAINPVPPLFPTQRIVPASRIRAILEGVDALLDGELPNTKAARILLSVALNDLR